MPDYMAEYIETMRQWTELNKDAIALYIAWYNIWTPYFYRKG
jgi:hypothetical protein